MRTLAYTPRYCAACTKNRSAVVCQHVFSQDAPASDLADFDQHRCDDAPDDGNRRAVATPVRDRGLQERALSPAMSVMSISSREVTPPPKKRKIIPRNPFLRVKQEPGPLGKEKQTP